MIEPMSQVTLLGDASGREGALEELRRLGVVHLQPVQPPQSPSLEEWRGRIRQLEEALAVLEAPLPPQSKASGASSGQGETPGHVECGGMTPLWLHRGKPLKGTTYSDVACPVEVVGSWGASLTSETQWIAEGMSVVGKVLDLQKRWEANQREVDHWQAMEQYQRSLGNFDPSSIPTLRQHGIHVRLYQGSAREVAPWVARGEVHRLVSEGDRQVVALVTGDEARTLPLTPMELPEWSLADVQTRLQEARIQWSRVESEMQSMAGVAGGLRELLRWCQDRAHLEEAGAGMGRAGEVVYLQGYCPMRCLPGLRELVQRLGWALWSCEPAPDALVPTWVRSSRVGRLFDPVMKFLGITPGYREYDTNVVFLVFFSLFFAMILGDAGYGLLLLGATAAWQWTGKGRNKPVVGLMYVLGVATVVWGTVTGNWFGLVPSGSLSFLGKAVVPSLASVSPDTSFLLRFCLGLGWVHLVLAHLMVAWRRASWGSLGEVGRALLVWMIYDMARWLLLGDAPGWWTTWMGVVGGGLMVLFGDQARTFQMRTLGRNLANLPMMILSVLGNFSDVISYIRLFAVGWAGLEVAKAFNGMAAGLGETGGWRWVLGLGVLVFGHTLNLALGAMGVLVHGVRLNVLEFARHMDIAWTGIPYQPFRSGPEADPERATRPARTLGMAVQEKGKT